MFHLDTAFAIELLALAAGGALLGWSGYAQVHAKKLVKAIAYAVIVLSVLTMLCTAYYGLKYTRMGYFRTPAGMMMPQGGMMDESMMGNGMMRRGNTQDSQNPDAREEGNEHESSTQESSSANNPHNH